MALFCAAIGIDTVSFLRLSLLYYSLRVFHTSVSWWSFTEVRVAASLIRSPGLFSVFWSILTIIYVGWSWFILWFSTLSALLAKPLETVPSAPTTTVPTVNFMFHSFFSSLLQVIASLFVFFFFIFTPWSTGIENFPSQEVLFFSIVNYPLVSSGWNKVICLYLRKESFMWLILQDGIWFVHIPFSDIVKI